jgi:hypothetical protein
MSILKKVFGDNGLDVPESFKRRIKIRMGEKVLYEIHILNDLYNMKPIKHYI